MTSTSIFSIAVFLLVLASFTRALDRLELEKQILDDILSPEKYDRHIRPKGKLAGGEGPVDIRMNIYLRSISKIDDINMEYDVQLTFRQEWTDSRLAYNTTTHDLPFVTLTEPQKLWTPDVFFSNEKRGHFHNIVTPNVLMRIKPNGAILYSVRISLTLACPMDLASYPMDTQTCSILMASYGYTTEDLVFLWKEVDPVQVSKNIHLPHFSMTGFNTDYCTSKTNTGSYTCLKINLMLKRELSYYFVHVYIPYVFMVMLSWIPFWLDYRATTARVAIWVTILLAMVITTTSIQSNIPVVSYTKSIDVWTGICLSFLFAVLIELAFVTQTVIKEEKENLLAVDDHAEANQTSGSKGKLGRLKKWLGKYRSRAMKIDVICRFAFPLAFLLFNLFYWSSYPRSS